MNETILNWYIRISVIIALMDVFLAIKSFQKEGTTGRPLGFACLGAAVVDISYMISILSGEYLRMSIMSSIYFVTIDIMLLCLLVFTVYFTRGRFTRPGKFLLGSAILYAAFEVLVFAVNPFFEIAVHYIPRNTIIARYSYQMEPPYVLHLVFT